MAKKLNEIHRTATFAWSPGQQLPFIAAGTVSGALDDSFSNASELELFKLDLVHANNKGLEPAGKVSTNARFNTLGWGHTTTDKPYGIIAGGMDSGELELWDPNAILEDKGAEEALILRNSTHQGPIRGLDFNSLQSNLLVSAGTNSEVYIWDLTNPTRPYSPGARSNKLDEVTSVAWNCQVQHILATSSTTGYTVVWDLRNRKEIMTLAAPGAGGMGGGHRGISSIAWHPDVATQIVTASEDDNNPVVTLWDLRHAHSPEKILAGHQKGVMGVSWCRQDSDLLMSCGKDCRTLCWNPRTGEQLGEVSHSSNWTFQADWCPRNPDLLATGSFDGKINVYSIQGAGSEEDSNAAANANQQTAADPNDPFSMLGGAPPQAQTFALKHPPKWLRRPVGASFSFSGKLVSFNNKAGQLAAQAAASLPPGSAPTTQQIPRRVTIATVVTDPEIVQRSEELESAVNENNFDKLIDERRTRSENTKDKDNAESWDVLKTLFAQDARQQLMRHLGFEKEQVLSAVSSVAGGDETTTAKQDDATTVPPSAESQEASTAVETVDESQQQQQENETPSTTQNEEGANEEATKATAPTDTLSGLFKSSDASASAEDFFGQQATTAQTTGAAATTEAADATVAPVPAAIVEPQEPLELYPKDSSETDQLITKAIVLGDLEAAVQLCLQSDRMSDALLLATFGGEELLSRTQKAYFERQSKKTSYLRLLQSVVDQDLTAVVQNATLEEWTSVVVVVCAYASANDLGPLCEALGSRLETAWSDANTKGEQEKAHEYRRHATLCYLAAGNLEKVSNIWIVEQEQSKDVENEDVYGASLQDLMEKVTVFRRAIDFEDNALVAGEQTVYPLAPLYNKYCEYAELLASQGKLDIALRYLELTPAGYRASIADHLAVIRDRVYRACASSTSGLGHAAVPPAFPFDAKPLLSERDQQAIDGAQTGFQQQQQPQQPQQQQQQPAFEPYKPNQGATAAAQMPVPQPVAAANPYAPAATGAYQPSNVQYSPFGQGAPAYGQTQPQQTGYDNYGYGAQYGNPYEAQQQSTAPPPPPQGAAVPPPPPPKARQAGSAGGSPSITHKPTGAWNDPPVVSNPHVTKSPAMAAAGTRRVTSPFPNAPAQSTFVNPPPTQQQGGMAGIPPPPQQGPPMGNAPPPPPPPMNAVAPTPMARQQQPPNQGFYAPRQTSTPPPPPTTASMAPPPQRGPPMMMGQQQVPPQPPMGFPAQQPPQPSPYAPTAAPIQQQQPQGPPPPQGQYAPPRNAGTPPLQQQQQSPRAMPPPGPPQATAAPSPPPAKPAAPPAPEKKRFPKDDRSHIPQAQLPIYQILSNQLQQARQRSPPSQKRMLDDTERRLNTLFDELNNSEVSDGVAQLMLSLVQALEKRDYDTAQRIQVDLVTTRYEECGSWLVGVKLLIANAKQTAQ
ncbi:hypothetical protein K492DRAFT_233927 [Lichtheimia hyalospora FSU 10163]|nr:hypothetical protein K492DRAFT_233927 [Lichtheimia hyalospora FSU 10163]